MTHEEINEAIAEHLYRGKGDLEIFLTHPHRPDYCNDLNAMHEAKKALADEERLDFMVALCLILGLSGEGKCWYDLECYEAWKVSGATAAQLAEAFLKTLNLWK